MGKDTKFWGSSLRFLRSNSAHAIWAFMVLGFGVQGLRVPRKLELLVWRSAFQGI